MARASVERLYLRREARLLLLAVSCVAYINSYTFARWQHRWRYSLSRDAENDPGSLKESGSPPKSNRFFLQPRPTPPKKFNKKYVHILDMLQTDGRTDGRTDGQMHRKEDYMGRLKMREWKNRHGRKCRGGKGGSGNIGTILQG